MTSYGCFRNFCIALRQCNVPVMTQMYVDPEWAIVVN